ncbi:MAG: acetylglutamate kinase, partial [Lachnospiraceae bacterium]|nr:acetylglutamate kinase [Lachnospiraceae bacterium]
VLLKLVGFKPIVVHGGGKAISKGVEKTGKEAEFYKGLRITDAETMEIAEMVLNRINKNLVAMAEQLGVRAIGISGKDGKLLNVNRRYVDGKDIGFVGDIKNVDAKILFDLLDADFLPIVAPIGLDDDFNTYNINADDAACEIAKAVGADKLAFLTDIDGLFRDLNDPTSLISRITTSEARGLINGGFIGGGMLPKLGNCIQAVEDGVRSVHILDGRIPHCLLLEIFTKKGIGTMIISDNDPIKGEE